MTVSGDATYACCGKVGRISRHESWCPTNQKPGDDGGDTRWNDLLTRAKRLDRRLDGDEIEQLLITAYVLGRSHDAEDRDKLLRTVSHLHGLSIVQIIKIYDLNYRCLTHDSIECGCELTLADAPPNGRHT